MGAFNKSIVIFVVDNSFLKVFLLYCCFYCSIVHSYFIQCPAVPPVLNEYEYSDSKHDDNNHNNNNNAVVAFCPMNNTCCHTYNPLSNEYIFSCIPNDLGSFNGACCTDDFQHSEYYNNDDENNNNSDDVISSTSTTTTGCGVGYTCMKDMGGKFCQQITNVTDPLVSILPRYQLCNQDQLNFNSSNNKYNTPSRPNMHGWPMKLVSTIETKKHLNLESDILLLPYYSTHGNIHTIFEQKVNNQSVSNIDSVPTSSSSSSIDTAVIVIHGAGRNADDYYCSMLAARELFVRKNQSNNSRKTRNSNDNSSKSDNILIIVPRFPLTTDNDTYVSVINSNGYNDVLQWDGTGTNSDDISGTWRYGADAVTTVNNTNKVISMNISSFDCIDSIIDSILNNVPSIQTISIIGHSSGGQFVQRWSFLTNIWDSIRMKAIVANPSSYLYFTKQRWQQQYQQQQKHTADNTGVPPFDNNVDMQYNNNDGLSEWYTPNKSECPSYNKWHYGLDFDLCSSNNNINTNNEYLSSNCTYKVRYVQQIIQNNVNNTIQHLINRYLYTRSIIYLIGQVDQCNVSQYDTSAWCYSHGLETTCPNSIQGITRYDRHWHYFMSLVQLVNENNNSNNQIHTSSHSEPNSVLLQEDQQQQQLFRHIRRTVPHVGHDHNLIMTSAVGLESIFGPIDSISSSIQTSTT